MQLEHYKPTKIEHYSRNYRWVNKAKPLIKVLLHKIKDYREMVNSIEKIC
jgi:hypothetical protein